ncbi:hypothetical protein CTEN210_14635 [Chaetoceros tenuissimus]|uniref:Uncharacterized protein n=1 Tax=Chaetoceros tenuissimus TaxID=426638 RepID=A0AAD3HCI3_9STRA|nr:hypothetical protein CTEN210_14635 [Chaetoceros tenuissimus]
MFSPSMSSVGSKSRKRNNHITARNRPSSNSKKARPNVFSPPIKGSIKFTPSRRSTRLPFSPLTNSVDRMRQADESVDESVDSFKKKVLHFESDSDKSTLDISVDQISNKKQEKEAQFKEAVDELMQDVEKEQEVSESVYEYEYPSEVKLTMSVLKSAHEQAIKYGTHQKDLHEANCSELSLTEVMIPSIIKVHNQQLKKIEGKAKGRKATATVKEIQAFRCLLKKAEVEMMKSAEDARAERKQVIRQERAVEEERKLQEKQEMQQQRKQELTEKQLQLQLNQEKEIERQRRQQRKEYKKNKELWREVAFLMRELGNIEKEEKRWRDLDATSIFGDSSLGLALADETNVQDEAKSFSTESAEEFKELHNIVNGITACANRICTGLDKIPPIVKEAEDVKDQVYEKYSKDHKWDGYRFKKAPKALFRALTMD